MNAIKFAAWVLIAVLSLFGVRDIYLLASGHTDSCEEVARMMREDREKAAARDEHARSEMERKRRETDEMKLLNPADVMSRKPQ